MKKELKETKYREYKEDYQLSSGYAQNIQRFAEGKYIDTLKGFKALNELRKKEGKPILKNMSCPYSRNPVEFPLDYRMLGGQKTNPNKHFQKDTKVKSLYWLSLINPTKKKQGVQKGGVGQLRNLHAEYIKNSLDYKKNINIPILVPKKIEAMIEKGYSYSFALHPDYIKITFIYKIEDGKKNSTFFDYLQKTGKIQQQNKRTLKIGLDFGKYIHVTDGTRDQITGKVNSRKYDLTKLYKKSEKDYKRVNILSSQIQKKKNKKEFDAEYKELNKEKAVINKKATQRVKTAYGFLLNNILKHYNPEIFNYEALTFSQIGKEIKGTPNKKYKGKKYNRMLRIMKRGVWIKLLQNKLLLAGCQGEPILPAYTSQECSQCGYIDKKNRNGIQFHCTSCGYIDHADANASLVIFGRISP